MNLRKAAQQALEALEEYEKSYQAVADGLKPLRAALAEDVPETNFGNMAQGVDSTEADNIPDAGKMVASVLEDRTVEATIKDCLTVEPVAYVTGYSKGRCIIEPVGYANKKGLFRCADDADEAFKASAIPLYATPPKREPLTEEEISAIDWKSGETLHDFARAIERAHGIGGEE